MTVYSDLLHAVDCGRKYRINLKEKTLKIDDKEIILEDRNLIEIKDLYQFHIGTLETDSWKILEVLYGLYKRSAPSAHYQGNKPYFKADDVEDLDDDEIAFNEPRNLMQAVIEGYVLLAGLSGWLKWKDENHWFWQAQGTNKDLVVLKEWL